MKEISPNCSADYMGDIPHLDPDDLQTRMWANAQRDGRPGECRWRPVRLYLTLQTLADTTTRVPCSNAAKMRNPLKFGGVPQTHQQISAASGLKFTIL